MFANTLLFPKTCPLCNTKYRENAPLCPECLANCTPLNKACTRCGLPLKSGIFHGCGNCIGKDLPFDALVGLYEYRSVDGLVLSLKFRASIPAARGIRLLIEKALENCPHIPELLKRVDVLTPIPLHWKRRLKREFNQSKLIAEIMGELTGTEVRNLLTRTRFTPPQTSLSATKRLKNPMGSIAVKGIPPEHVAVIDDVATTTATLSEAARVLKNAGARKVICITFARST